jgi:hypothetical protein
MLNKTALDYLDSQGSRHILFPALMKFVRAEFSGNRMPGKKPTISEVCELADEYPEIWAEYKPEVGLHND